MHLRTKRSVFLSILLSALTPGLGQVYNGKIYKALLFYTLFIIIILLKIFFLNDNFAGLNFGYILNLLLYIYITYDSIRLSLTNKDYELKRINKWYLYIIFILLHFLLYIYLLIPIKSNYSRFIMFNVQGESNYPALEKRDGVVIDRWYYKFNKLKRNDFVTFINPDFDKSNDLNSKHLIKRCVGIPGDKIEIKNFELYVNDVLINYYPINIDSEDKYFQKMIGQEETVLDENTKKAFKEAKDIMLLEYTKSKNYGPVFVKENTFFCLGDNRSNSMDSRVWGGVSYNKIYGKVKYIYSSSNISNIGKKL